MDRRNFLQGIASVAVASAIVEHASATIPDQMIAPDRTLPRMPVVTVCGVGAGGCKIINHLMVMDVEGVTEYVCVATDKSDLDNCAANRKLLVGHGDYLSKGTLASRRANLLEIRALLDGADVVIVIAGLGGDAEAEIATDVANCSGKSGQQVASLLLMPFFYGGIDSEIGARHGMILPQINSHVSMVISTEAIRGSLGHMRPMAEYLAVTDNAVLRALRAMVAMTTSGQGLLNPATAAVSHASAGIYAAELLREAKRCAVETEVALYEMKAAASSLREENRSRENLTDDHYVASEALHSSMANVFEGNAKVTRLELAGSSVESLAELKAARTELDSMERVLKVRQGVLEETNSELVRRIENCSAWETNIKRSRESILVWSESLAESLSELKSSAMLIGHDPDVSRSIAHATAVLADAKTALGDVEIARLVHSVEMNLA